LRANRASRPPPVATGWAPQATPSGADMALAAMLAVQCLGIFVTGPLSAAGSPALVPATKLIFLAYVVLVLFASQSRQMRIVTVAAAGADIAAGLCDLAIGTPASDVVADAAHIAAYGVLGYVVARTVFASGPVTTYRVVGAIVLVPAAFNGIADTADGAHRIATVIYFSLVTLSSTGYGDIVPVHPIARSLANLEQVIGQLFPATLLASLVSRHLESRRR
jgi:hypothetical protein